MRDRSDDRRDAYSSPPPSLGSPLRSRSIDRSARLEATVDALTLYVSVAAAVLLAGFFLHWT